MLDPSENPESVDFWPPYGNDRLQVTAQYPYECFEDGSSVTFWVEASSPLVITVFPEESSEGCNPSLIYIPDDKQSSAELSNSAHENGCKPALKVNEPAETEISCKFDLVNGENTLIPDAAGTVQICL